MKTVRSFLAAILFIALSAAIVLPAVAGTDADPIDVIVYFERDETVNSGAAVENRPAAFYKVSRLLDITYECGCEPAVIARGDAEAVRAVSKIKGVEKTELLPDDLGCSEIFEDKLAWEQYLADDNDVIRFMVRYEEDDVGDFNPDGITWLNGTPTDLRTGEAKKKDLLAVEWPTGTKSVIFVPYDNTDTDDSVTEVELTDELRAVLDTAGDDDVFLFSVAWLYDGTPYIFDAGSPRRFAALARLLRKICFVDFAPDGGSVYVCGTKGDLYGAVFYSALGLVRADLLDPNDLAEPEKSEYEAELAEVGKLIAGPVPDETEESSSPDATEIGPVPEYIPGDTDGDGEITAADARLALRQAIDLEQYERGSREFLSADADGDGEVTASDARSILRVAIELDPYDALRVKK